MSRKSVHALLLPVALALLYAILFYLIEHSRMFPLRTSNFGWSMGNIDAISQGSVKRQVAFLALGVSGALLLAKRNRTSYAIRRGALMVILLFVGWGWLSCLWADEPYLVVKRAASFSLLLLAAFALARKVEKDDFLVIIFGVTSAYLLIGVVSELKLGTFQLIASGHRFMGTLHPEGQGFNCALLFLTSLALADRNRPPWRTAFRGAAVVALVFLILTRSRGPFGGMIIACAIYFFFTRKRHLVLQIVYFALFLVLSSIFLFGPGEVGGAALLGREREVSSLTGRLPLWTDCWTYVEQRPLTGYGFNGFWTAERSRDFSEASKWFINSAHSIYLGTLLDLGAVGLALFLILLMASYFLGVRDVRRAEPIPTAFCLGLLVLMAADGLLSQLVIDGGFVTFVLFCVVFYLSFSTAPTTDPARETQPGHRSHAVHRDRTVTRPLATRR